GVHEVLVDGRELSGENVVEELDDAGGALHAAQATAATASSVGASSSSRASMRWQPPQSVPARQRAPRSSMLCAPASTAAFTALSLTASQWQTIIQGAPQGNRTEVRVTLRGWSVNLRPDQTS